MTCPKCGKELIIGSTLCPDCDVFEEPPKARRRLSRRGKRILISAGAAILLIILFAVTGRLLQYRVKGAENGNGINLSYAENVNGDFYYSVDGTLYGCDSRFKKTEVIDKGGEIYALNDFFGELYYVKDSVLCRYNPQKRVKTDILKLPHDKNLALIGKSKRGMYFQIGENIHFLDMKTDEIYALCKGEGVIGGGKLYVFENENVTFTPVGGGEKEILCKKGEFEKPVFISGGKIYCINYKEMTVFTIDRRSGEKNIIFKSSEHSGISDVSRFNFDGKNLYFTGVDGIYRYNIKNGEINRMTETGYVNSICMEAGKIFCKSPEGESYFADLSGKILFSTENDD